jgi:serine/threonine protein kinase
MDTALSPPTGRLLGGRYHVGTQIARGGMATVYVGTDTRLDRMVAIKIAHPEISDDADFVRRFIGEARQRPGCPAPTSSPSTTRARTGGCTTSRWSTCLAGPYASY